MQRIPLYRICIILGIIGVGLWWYALLWFPNARMISPIGNDTSVVMERPLDRYAIPSLAARSYDPQPIRFDEIVATASGFTEYNFSYRSDGRRVTGRALVPVGKGPFPVVVQCRGYADKTVYVPGYGTRPSAGAFAKDGFMTLAPDYLGYGGSDEPPPDVFEERFLTYVATLDLLVSIPDIPSADSERVFLWGHSNGGQIALTVLEILGLKGQERFSGAWPLGATLWAPVTKPFPNSILYYTDEADDHGKAMRRKLADFEVVYEASEYSLATYLTAISIPIQIHQGTSDDAVPYTWNDAFTDEMTKLGKDVIYYRYENADHNMKPVWNTVVARDVTYFRSLE